jgi:hypothetical protein
VDVHAGFLATGSAEQFVHRGVIVLPCDVPERDVDRRERPGDRRTAEVGVPIEVLVVVIPSERIPIDEILSD